MALFRVHWDVEILGARERLVRGEEVRAIKEGDIEDRRLPPLYRIPLTLAEMKELAAEMARVFGVLEPEVEYTGRAGERDELGRLRNGRCDWTRYPVTLLSFNREGENAGTFVHEFAHHLQFWWGLPRPAPEHGPMFRSAQREILGSKEFWRKLGEMGKIRGPAIECSYASE